MTSQTILGLDLASKTGWAHSNGNGGVIDLRNKEKDWGQMAVKFHSNLSFIIESDKPDRIISELPPNRLLGAARMILLGLHWQARGIAKSYGIPFSNVAVPTLKKWATGSGKADKKEMIRAACDLGWQQPIDDNHADAILICKWGEECFKESKE